MPLVDRECQCSPSRLARIHLALADPIRLRMLALIRAEALNSEQLSQVLALDPHIIAKHLTYLRDGGVVSMRRRGKITYYSVRTKATCAESQLVHLTLDLLRLEPYMDGEFAMLKAVCELEAECQDAEDGRVGLSAQNGLQNVIEDLPVCNELPSTSRAHINQSL